VVPDIITNPRTAIFRAMAGGLNAPTCDRTNGRCALIKPFAQFIDPDFMRSYVVHNVCAKLESQ
jgi:hypothetical protein